MAIGAVGVDLGLAGTRYGLSWATESREDDARSTSPRVKPAVFVFSL